MIRKLEGHHNDVVSCEFSPDGALLATASYDTRVIVWDPHTATILLELGHLFPPPSPIFAGGANDRWVRSVAFCHDGRHIASVTDDRASFWERSHASHMTSINHYEAACFCSHCRASCRFRVEESKENEAVCALQNGGPLKKLHS